ncbi:Putative protein phosphatase 2C-type [Maioricimonas rarisocia]|uniref:PPM-type phosphatase domain-containing protein n=1 Tax=Maioricimonas rarisocia TaxID=2528026 RepID=A0A517Z9S2_9PLAN|nr:protein phosphatase 2C domain-containing protein [Maioricimonas rarisocia]QDU39180.1 Putative protein phosphatase 2C-type [Maioricimonas rarisocia]
MPRDADENPPDSDGREAVRIYRETGIDSVTTRPFAGGIVTVVSTACPGKTTPNEDSAGLVDCGTRAGVLLVADGVGGHRGGEFASENVVRIVAEHLDELRASHGTSASPVPRGMIRAAILDGLDQANQKLLESGLGCATTLAAVEINGREIRPFHVGDSEILVVGQRGKVKLQTVSHSPVGFAIEAGLLDETEAIHHEDRHVVSNVVGTVDMRVEMGTPVTLAANDTLLIASDGLFDNLRQDEIIEAIRKGPLDEAVRRLATLARERMEDADEGVPSKPDDLTIIAFRSPLPRRKRRRKKRPEQPAVQPQHESKPRGNAPPESVPPAAVSTTASVTVATPTAEASGAAEETGAVDEGEAATIPDAPAQSDSPAGPAPADEQSGVDESPPERDRTAETSTETSTDTAASSDESKQVPPPAHTSWWPFRTSRK